MMQLTFKMKIFKQANKKKFAYLGADNWTVATLASDADACKALFIYRLNGTMCTPRHHVGENVGARIF